MVIENLAFFYCVHQDCTNIPILCTRSVLLAWRADSLHRSRRRHNTTRLRQPAGFDIRASLEENGKLSAETHKQDSDVQRLPSIGTLNTATSKKKMNFNTSSSPPFPTVSLLSLSVHHSFLSPISSQVFFSLSPET